MSKTKKAPAKGKPSIKDVKTNRKALLEKASEAPAPVESVKAEEVDPDQSPAPVSITAPEPPPLTAPPLTLVTDTATLFWRGAEELTAQLLGTDQSALMLKNVYEWEGKLKKLKKLLVGDEDTIEGLKKHVLDNGQPWGDKGSKQMTMAGVVVKVKAVNYRTEAPLAISDLDEKKVEAYLRGVVWTDPIEKVLACYMKPVTVWTLKDLPPVQVKNLNAMLADPGEDGQGLRQCLKDTKYQMMAPEMENET